jgi:hypothetical protein
MDITKLDAAKMQISTAIRLYFEDCDAVSVHTLATAGGEVIDQICKARGLVSIRNGLLDAVVPDRRKGVADALNKPRNFFKHSKGDPNELLHDFDDERNFFAILVASDGLRLLGMGTQEVNFLERGFRSWSDLS